MSQEKKVKFKWNGQEIEAKEGQNLLQAAIDHGIEVAHYCYHPGLSVAGVCRMCMVEQEGVPRIFPACNAKVQEGISVSNQSPNVENAVKWALQLHLVNHPLDCPICDQAGECGLQEYFMKHGQYDSAMVDQKVHKKKVQDIGRGVMLDAERCILCSRCTRFTSEVTETFELGILNRGDHAEIAVEKQLCNDYAMNLVDICPVGALTSQDFRFQQRVWFLKDVETTCIGCETGCSVKVSQNENGVYRVKPRYDEEVNGHWICDDGREIYKHVSRSDRLYSPMRREKDLFVPTQLTSILTEIADKKVHYVLHTGLTNEEYFSFFEAIQGKEALVSLYRLPNIGKDFDGLLKRGNKNPNLLGAEHCFNSAGYDPSVNFLQTMVKEINNEDVVVLAVPEILYDRDHFITLLKIIPQETILLGLTSNDSDYAFERFNYLLPLPTFLEKEGTLINFENKRRHLHAGRKYGETGHNVADYARLFSGAGLDFK